ncbi:hypothetical protein K402DRAFT_418015 [Aulographum hederae CBS 113979]|uniref:F-box domain-containing protein n=1 Tax=Aulographum hederae CBS 113979 TaxID=1176131 RepID=A0A6G1HA20_9PEZI|nr:hypothetical protein K402DRAFT_418015 [Aulographum hederae CBS 113979]
MSIQTEPTSQMVNFRMRMSPHSHVSRHLSPMVAEDEAHKYRWPNLLTRPLTDVLRLGVEAMKLPRGRSEVVLHRAKEGKDESAALALLLAAASKLESLDLAFAEDENVVSDLFFQFHGTNTTGSRPLSSLTDVMIAGDSLRYSFSDFSHFAACLKLPKLKHFYGHLLESHYSARMAAMIEKFEPQSSSVSFIEFRCCMLDNRHLQAFLRVPKALKTFIYEIVPWEGLDAANICAALKPIETTLEELGLSYDVSVFESTEYSHDVFTPVSFQKLTALKRLKIAVACLFEEWAIAPRGVMTDEDYDEVLIKNTLPRALPDQLEELRLRIAAICHAL